MYTNYNIPQNRNFNQRNFSNQELSYGRPSVRPHYSDGDRFIGGGFLGPFLLGGVGGYLLGRPNYQGPIPVFFPQGRPYQPYPIPYYGYY